MADAPGQPAVTMQQRIDAEIDAAPLGHEWVAQATISLDNKTAKRAAFRSSFRTEAGMKVAALDVVCHVCRRAYDDVADTPRCDGKIDNTHLIGGDQTVRAKRIVHEPTGTVFTQPISRLGMAGYSVHAGQ